MGWVDLRFFEKTRQFTNVDGFSSIRCQSPPMLDSSRRSN